MKNESVVVGKNVIEILTTGMYHNPLDIFREYIQNSVDAINEALENGILDDPAEGEIHVTIDKNNRTVLFDDNGAGVSVLKAWTVLTSIAASTKDRAKHLGFRGIGRLAGLAYCDELVIETSSKGEPLKTVLKWDGDKLREIIADRADKKLASEVIETVTTIDSEFAEEEDAHYFKIKLINVRKDKLLEVESVVKYLRMVAPLKFYFPQFMWASDINQNLINLGVKCEGFRVFVNTTELFKPYRNNIYQEETKGKKKIDEIIDIQYIELHSKNNELLAVGWYAITKLLQLIPVFNEAWGIRFRKGNIQIGEAFSFHRFFRDGRFHRYFLGEIHVVHDDLFPNGQRDYFDECPLLSEFEEQLKLFTEKLHFLCHKASDWNSAEKIIVASVKDLENFEENLKSEDFISPEHEKSELDKLERIRENCLKAEQRLKKIEENSDDNETLKKFVEHRLKTKPTIDKKKEIEEPKKVSGNGKKYKANKLSKLSKDKQKLVGEIYEIIRTVLPPDLQNSLILKIQEHFGLARSSE